MLEFLIFVLVSVLIVVCSFFVISSSNTIHSVLFLILVFFNSSILLILMGVEFLSLIFIIIYVGAIAVLFLFVIMMLNVKIIELTEMMFKYVPLSALMGFIFIFEAYIMVFNDMSTFSLFNLRDEVVLINWIFHLNDMTNIKVLGQLIYTYNFFSFMLSGLILLLAMIGSIVLTLTFRVNVKRQVIWNQVNKNFIKIINKV